MERRAKAGWGGARSGGAGVGLLGPLVCASLLAAPGGAALARPTGVSSPAGDPADLEALSLEELMEVQVISVSKRPEPMSRAPAAVSVYSSQALERYGYYTLADVADITPGYSSYTVFGERVLETRGQKAGSFNNNKHLLLVDGVPLHHAKSYKVPTEYELPLFFADQVEMVRGPSSTLYGTSAFLGVISLTSKGLEAQGTVVESKITLGLPASRRDVQPWEFQRRFMGNALHRSDRHQVSLNASYFAKRPSQQVAGGLGDARPDAYVDPGSSLTWDDQQSLFVRFSDQVLDGPFQGLSMGVMLLDKTGGLGEFWEADVFSHEANMLRWTTLQPYLRYARRFRPALEVRGYARYNQSREQGFPVGFGEDGFVSEDGSPILATYPYDQWVNDVELNGEIYYDPLPVLGFVMGATYDTRRMSSGGREGYSYPFFVADGEPVPVDSLTASTRVNTVSVYAESTLDLDVLAGLRFNLGARADAGLTRQQNYHQISPRGGVVLTIVEPLALRALYTSALRGPSIKEFSLNEEARGTLQQRGLPTDRLQPLAAETIQSAEGGLALETRHVVASAAGYFTRTRHPLDGVIYMGENIFANTAARVDVVGFEVEVKAPVTTHLPVTVNAAWSHGRDEDGNDVADVPVAKINGGIGYGVPAWADLRAHAWVKWVTGYRVSDPSLEPYAGHVTLDANLMVRVAEHFDLELMLTNLTGATYYYPFGGQPRAPGAPRSILLTLSQHTY